MSGETVVTIVGNLVGDPSCGAPLRESRSRIPLRRTAGSWTEPTARGRTETPSSCAHGCGVTVPRMPRKPCTTRGCESHLLWTAAKADFRDRRGCAADRGRGRGDRTFPAVRHRRRQLCGQGNSQQYSCREHRVQQGAGLLPQILRVRQPGQATPCRARTRRPSSSTSMAPRTYSCASARLAGDTVRPSSSAEWVASATDAARSRAVSWLRVRVAITGLRSWLVRVRADLPILPTAADVRAPFAPWNYRGRRRPGRGPERARRRSVSGPFVGPIP